MNVDETVKFGREVLERLIYTTTNTDITDSEKLVMIELTSVTSYLVSVNFLISQMPTSLDRVDWNQFVNLGKSLGIGLSSHHHGDRTLVDIRDQFDSAFHYFSEVLERDASLECDLGRWKLSFVELSKLLVDKYQEYEEAFRDF